MVVALSVAALAAAQLQTVGASETFSAAKLSANETQEIVAAIEQSVYDTPDSWEQELRVRRVDVGSGQGLVVSGTKLLCGATGNCQIWVFLNTNGRWVSLFEGGDPPIAEGFQFGPGASHGVKDLTTSTNSSAERSKHTTYRFDGKVYRVGP